MNKETALKAADAAFEAAIDRMHQVFVDGLIGGEPPADLTARFRTGFARNVEAHTRIAAEIEAYFKE